MNEDKLIQTIIDVAKDRFVKPLSGIHGIDHWHRVHENGVYLAKHSGGNTAVVRLFAYLHDCCRESDGFDPAHGKRAADFAKSIREQHLAALSDDAFELLYFACEYHERGRVSDDPTVGSCWDSDRLDLGRVGIRPNPKLLSTERARRQSVIDWGWKRSRGQQASLKGI